MSRADRLIGRESALAAASSVLDDARRGAGQFLMISGEAGIGKTAMLAALIDRVGPVPLVLRGFCQTRFQRCECIGCEPSVAL